MKRLGKHAEEECYLGRTEHKSKVCRTIQGHLLGSSIDKDCIVNVQEGWEFRNI